MHLFPCCEGGRLTPPFVLLCPQSLAGDGIFPWRALHFFAKGRGANKEPIRAYFLTYAIVVACCLLGKLDIVAPVISNFFMISCACAVACAPRSNAVCARL